jgi:hypothetical protein
MPPKNFWKKLLKEKLQEDQRKGVKQGETAIPELEIHLYCQRKTNRTVMATKYENP